MPRGPSALAHRATPRARPGSRHGLSRGESVLHTSGVVVSKEMLESRSSAPSIAARRSWSARGGTLSTGVGLFVPKPTPFVVYLANVLLGLQLGVWLRPPMSGIGTARCYSVGYSSAWWARYRITRRYCTRSAATNQRDASRAWRRSANGRRGRNSCTSRLRDCGAWGSLRPRAGRSPGPADWAVSGRTGTTWQPPQDHWGPT
jgi:hypothetical protein